MAESQNQRAGIREARRLMEDVQKMDGNEAETRRRVERIFETIMNYDAFKHLSREHAVHGAGDTEHMDFAIKIVPDKVYMVVELKRVNVDLSKNHLKQASRYAIDIGSEWILLTNGRQWELYHIEFGQPPETRLIERWNLMLDDVNELVEKFELISLQNLKRGVLDKLWEKQGALTPDCLLRIILAEDAIRLYKNAIRRDTGVSVHPEDIVGAIRRLFNEQAATLMDGIKISLPERKARTVRPAAPAIQKPTLPQDDANGADKLEVPPGALDQ